jgi:DNA-binding transcriptional LysR family regulator
MELRQLRYAVRLAETLHFGRAAQGEFITQSAFSQQIARLERECGTPLFERSSNRVSLTPAGELFIRHATRMLSELDAMRAEIQRIATGTAGTLRVGVFAEGAGELTPLLFDAFRAAYPAVDLHIVELSISTQVEMLAGGAVDVALLRPPIPDPRLELHVLFAEPRFAGLPAGHPLAAREDLSIKDLAGEPFVAASGSPPWSGFWRCAGEGVPAGESRASVDSVAESLAAIGFLGAVDTFPASAARRFPHPGVAYVRLRDGGYAAVAVAHRRGDDRTLVSAFRELAERTTREHLDVVPLAVLPQDAPPGTPLPYQAASA